MQWGKDGQYQRICLFFAVEALVPGGGSRIRPKKIQKMPSGRYQYQNLLFQIKFGSVIILRVMVCHHFWLECPDPPFCAFFVSSAFFRVNATHAFFIVTKAIGGSKKRSFDEKNMGRKSKTRERSLFWAQKAQKKENKTEKLRFFGANPRFFFFGKKARRGSGCNFS